MNRRTLTTLVAGVAIATLGAGSLMAHDDDDDRGGRDHDGRFVVHAALVGFQEVPALSTTAHVRSLQLTLKSSRAASALVHGIEREIATIARRLRPINHRAGVVCLDGASVEVVSAERRNRLYASFSFSRATAIGCRRAAMP